MREDERKRGEEEERREEAQIVRLIVAQRGRSRVPAKAEMRMRGHNTTKAEISLLSHNATKAEMRLRRHKLTRSKSLFPACMYIGHGEGCRGSAEIPFRLTDETIGQYILYSGALI